MEITHGNVTTTFDRTSTGRTRATVTNGKTTIVTTDQKQWKRLVQQLQHHH